MQSFKGINYAFDQLVLILKKFISLDFNFVKDIPQAGS